MDFPAPMDIKAIYHIAGTGLLEIELLAQSERGSLCNLASHIYSNLGG
ncbi:MAG: hypothetical protein OIF56_00935 [Cohaesibacter sp.]|nr:hypothetical protein [Cohaesibacter sp.]MCV6600309.1 hypothetical protein [Cohaesibacter sp.]